MLQDAPSNLCYRHEYSSHMSFTTNAMLAAIIIKYLLLTRDLRAPFLLFLDGDADGG